MPTVAEALRIAIAHQQAGRYALAEQVCRQILAAVPDHAETWDRLGLIAHDQGRHQQALTFLDEALRLAPTLAHVHNNRGMVCRALGRIDEAVASYEHALRLNPDAPQTWYNLGNLRRAVGELVRAVDCYHRALRLKPDYTMAELNLGTALQDQGQPDLAIACYQRVIERVPDFAGAHNNLGVARQSQGKLAAAIDSFRRAIALEPGYADAFNNLGAVLLDQGRLDEALASYRKALVLRPDFRTAMDNYLCALRYSPRVGQAELVAACTEYEQRFVAPLMVAGRPYPNSRDPDRPLRLGFVSPDFARGPVGTFLIGPLEHLDPRQCQIYCYSDRLTPDALTARFQAVAAEWQATIGVADDALAEQIRHDQIDILFDLAGHAQGNRLLVFARRPAPVQITWIDSVGTTGLKAIDYLLADRHTFPPTAETGCVEQVLRMPDGSVCYDPPPEAPPVGPLPALARGQITFASFNNPAKIGPEVVQCWSQILSRVPGARLILKYAGFDDVGTVQHYRDLFAQHGVNASRLELRGRSPLADCLREYQEVDLALDPFPHTGGLTTCDALWMGIPVVTCPGDTFASRQGLSYLTTIGLSETIADTPERYVGLAVELAHDLPRLAALREGLRSRMAQSPLCDAQRFAANLLGLLRGAWQAWVASNR
jgi:predicted O-linked N-acetylglucosamine transferase (SPINDLY family)